MGGLDGAAGGVKRDVRLGRKLKLRAGFKGRGLVDGVDGFMAYRSAGTSFAAAMGRGPGVDLMRRM